VSTKGGEVASWGARIDDEWNTLMQWMSENDTLIA
jgi:hypothetical protein